mmetsp:Transcript_2146/g.2355  ORF Transcript_2146/g.2355 Transcript_2146/m.2355 type:complete len:248 (+) Transcript_2146:243-986(+)
MQKSCIDDPSKYDCTEGLRLLEIFTSSKSLCKITTITRLFANCNCGNSRSNVPGKISNIGTAPNPQLFAEDFPSDLNGPGWELYSTKNYNPFGNNTTQSISYAWRGNVTTVSNKAYGITAGMNVDLVVIFATLPARDIIVKSGLTSRFAFSSIYADVAQEQYNSSLSLFKKWQLPEQWGTGTTHSYQYNATTTATAAVINNNDHQTSSFGVSTLAVACMVLIGGIVVVKRHSEYRLEGYTQIITGNA